MRITLARSLITRIIWIVCGPTILEYYVVLQSKRNTTTELISTKATMRPAQLRLRASICVNYTRVMEAKYIIQFTPYLWILFSVYSALGIVNENTCTRGISLSILYVCICYLQHRVLQKKINTYREIYMFKSLTLVLWITIYLKDCRFRFISFFRIVVRIYRKEHLQLAALPGSLYLKKKKSEYSCSRRLHRKYVSYRLSN